MLDFGNGCNLSLTATHSLVTDLLIFDPAPSKNLMWDFNYDQRFFDKKSRFFLVHFYIRKKRIFPKIYHPKPAIY